MFHNSQLPGTAKFANIWGLLAILAAGVLVVDDFPPPQLYNDSFGVTTEEGLMI